MCSPFVANQFGRHGFEFAAVKHIQEHGGKDVVAVMSQGDFGAAQFFCGAVEDAAAQAAAQRTSRFAFVQHAFDGGVGVFFNDFVGERRCFRDRSAILLRGNPAAFWSRLTATSSKSIGALAWSWRRMSNRA